MERVQSQQPKMRKVKAVYGLAPYLCMLQFYHGECGIPQQCAKLAELCTASRRIAAESSVYGVVHGLHVLNFGVFVSRLGDKRL